MNSKNVASNLLAEYTVTGSAVTSIDFSGLDINTHKSYRIEAEIYNPTASASDVYLYINGDTTATNYYGQQMYATTTSVAGTRYNFPSVSYLDSSSYTSTGIGLSIRNGYPIAVATTNFGSPSLIGVSLKAYKKTATVTNITQLTFTSTVANAIGVGSTIRIYRGDV